MLRDIDVPVALPFDDPIPEVGRTAGRKSHLPSARRLPLQDQLAASVGSKLQLKLWYDKLELQLIVTVIGAFELSPREDGSPRNAYVKIHLLPDRR